jgi:hypothetical protein
MGSDEKAKTTWTRGPSNAFNDSVDIAAVLRTKLAAVTEVELIAFGRQMRGLVYPRSYDGAGKVQVSAFSIQLDEAQRRVAATPSAPSRTTNLI